MQKAVKQRRTLQWRAENDGWVAEMQGCGFYSERGEVCTLICVSRRTLVVVTSSGSRTVYTVLWMADCKANRVLFPGALNSEFTNTMEFIRPSTHKAIPTYRVMNQYGEVIEKEIGVDTEEEEALQLYRNMVCCMPPLVGSGSTVQCELTPSSEHNGPSHV
jgi:hypothetical protein